MTLRIILIATTLLLFLGCSKIDTDIAELPERTIEVEITNTEIITLDGKELHVSFFENVFKSLSNSYDLTVDINVQPDAMTGVVMDVTHLVYKYKPSLAYHTSHEE